MKTEKKKISRDEALQKLYRFCAFQERCRLEVSQKLVEWGFALGDDEKLIDQLIRENYMNEERFALAFARGKFNQKKWGTQKIVHGLKQKGISDALIQQALSEIPENEYAEVLLKLARAKAKTVLEKDIFKKKFKIAKFLIGKGYVPDQVWEVVNAEFI